MASAKSGGAAMGAPIETTNDDDGAMLVRKISPKTIMGKVTIPLKSDGKPYVDEDGVPVKFPDTVLYSVFGLSHGIRTGTGDNGPFCAFLGSFEAVRSKDGKRFQGGQCFVPKAIEDLLVASMKAGQKDDPSASVEFAVEIGIKFAQTAVGYEYTIKNLVKTKNADPLADLRSRLANSHPTLAALAAPK
ncbi:MAG: hypothetical protein WBR29_03150 [Gammaproteobacteria bacterium]